MKANHPLHSLITQIFKAGEFGAVVPRTHESDEGFETVMVVRQIPALEKKWMLKNADFSTFLWIWIGFCSDETKRNKLYYAFNEPSTLPSFFFLSFNCNAKTFVIYCRLQWFSILQCLYQKSFVLIQTIESSNVIKCFLCVFQLLYRWLLLLIFLISSYFCQTISLVVWVCNINTRLFCCIIFLFFWVQIILFFYCYATISHLL